MGDDFKVKKPNDGDHWDVTNVQNWSVQSSLSLHLLIYFWSVYLFSLMTVFGMISLWPTIMCCTCVLHPPCVSPSVLLAVCLIVLFQWCFDSFWDFDCIVFFLSPGCHINSGVDTNKYIYIDPNLSLSLHFGCKPPSPVSGDRQTDKQEVSRGINFLPTTSWTIKKNSFNLKSGCFEEGLLWLTWIVQLLAC